MQAAEEREHEAYLRHQAAAEMLDRCLRRSRARPTNYREAIKAHMAWRAVKRARERLHRARDAVLELFNQEDAR